MKAKYVLVTVFALAALGLTIHRGFTQSTPVVVGPGVAPNVGTPADPNALKYYGGYYEPYYDPTLYAPVANPYNVFFGANDIPRTPDKITTKLTGTSVAFQWDGEPRAVKSITFELLDKNNAVISKQVVTNLPTRATLKKTAKATGYSVNIIYINGMTNSVVSPL